MGVRKPCRCAGKINEPICLAQLFGAACLLRPIVVGLELVQTMYGSAIGRDAYPAMRFVLCSTEGAKVANSVLVLTKGVVVDSIRDYSEK